MDALACRLTGLPVTTKTNWHLQSARHSVHAVMHLLVRTVSEAPGQGGERWQPMACLRTSSSLCSVALHMYGHLLHMAVDAGSAGLPPRHRSAWIAFG